MSVWTTAHLVATGTFDDPTHARIIYLAAGGLVLLAVLLGVGTWWWWRSAKVEHPVLAPLEVMSTRRWAKADFAEQQKQLDGVRPEHEGDDASPPAEPVDLDHVLTRDDPSHFDDLAEPAPADAVVADGAVADAAVADGAEVESGVEPVGGGPSATQAAAEAAVVAEAEAITEAADDSASVEPAVESASVEPAVDEAVVAVVEPEPTVGATDETTPVEADPAAVVAAVAVVDPPVAAPKPIVVIDTAPSAPPAVAPEPLPEPVDELDDATPTHIDPLLRSKAE